jgi:hypothetical protein
VTFPYDSYIAQSMRKGRNLPTAFALGQSFDNVPDAQDAVIRAFDRGLAIPVVACPTGIPPLTMFERLELRRTKAHMPAARKTR